VHPPVLVKEWAMLICQAVQPMAPQHKVAGHPLSAVGELDRERATMVRASVLVRHGVAAMVVEVAGYVHMCVCL
jgi:hypothetical protein